MTFNFDLLDEILSRPDITAKVIRERYLGKKIDLDKIPDSCVYDEGRSVLAINFSHFREYYGVDIICDITLSLSDDLTIKKIGALHCEKSTGDDATSSGYSNKRADEIDYWELDSLLGRIIKKDET